MYPPTGGKRLFSLRSTGERKAAESEPPSSLPLSVDKMNFSRCKFHFSEVKAMKEMIPKETAIKMPRLKLEEAIRWLVNQPDIAKMVFESAIINGLIVYDYKTGQWRGADYED